MEKVVLENIPMVWKDSSDLDKYRDDNKQYRWLNFKRRAMQTFFGGRIFTLPGLSQIKNKAYSKSFHAGNGFKVFYDVNFSRTHSLNGTTVIGNNVHINWNVHIDYSGDVVIGNDVDIAENTIILSHKHPSFRMVGGRGQYKAVPARTIICDGVHIQVGCIIYPGVVIGEYANIYSGSVVMEDVEPYGVVMGNPARDVRDVLRDVKRTKKGIEKN